ncbi:MAG: SGNH/GDSL hydrolase family protein [Myxococcota bacterium]
MTLTYRINQLGFRGREATLEKPDGQLRVVGLGDSFTFGVGVRLDDTFLAVLETRLREAGGPHPVEVMNLGVMGSDTSHQVNLLRHLGLRLAPDLVVLCFFLNDAGGGSTHSQFNVGLDSEHAAWRRSRLLDRAVHLLQRPRQVRALVSNYRRSFEPNALGWASSRRALTQADRLSEAYGFDLVLMIFPVLWQLSDHYPFRDIHETVRAAAEAAGMPVLDLLPAFAGHDGPELWVTPNNQHPNEIAHAIAGEALSSFLAARGLPRPRGG